MIDSPHPRKPMDMTTTSTPGPPDADEADKVAQRLLRASADHAQDPAVDIDWQTPLEPETWFMPPEMLTLYGTELWQRMDRRQRLELSRSEAVNWMSMGVWVELCLMRMLARHLSDRDYTALRSRYTLTELGEETRHSLMFGQAIRHLGSGSYLPPRMLRKGFDTLGSLLHGPSLFAVTLTQEEMADQMQRDSMADERLQPLVRQVMRLHVIEEARHVRFARTELREALKRTSARGLAFHREVTGVAVSIMMQGYTSPLIYRAVGIDPVRARRQARDNEHYRRFLVRAGEKATGFLTDVGMISRAQHHWWRRAGLIA